MTDQDRLRYFMDRMRVHAALTGRHLEMAPADSLPALVALAFRMAEDAGCADVLSRRVLGFMVKRGFVTREDWETWQ